MPAEACVAPWPAGRASMSSTGAPRRASSYVTAQPITPAPTTRMSRFTGRSYMLRLRFKIADFRLQIGEEIVDWRLEIGDWGLEIEISMRFQIQALEVLQSAICNLKSGICNLRSAICNLRSAICNLKSAI